MKGKHKRTKRAMMNRHHLLPRSSGGNGMPNNLLLIDIEKHQAWHKLFKNRHLDEVIEMLIRLKQLKGWRYDYGKGNEGKAV